VGAKDYVLAHAKKCAKLQGASRNAVQTLLIECLRLIRRHSAADFFLRPVDEGRDVAPGYYMIIDRHTEAMDLQTIEDRIDDGTCDSMAQFKILFQRIVDSCVKFNQNPDSLIRRDLATLQKLANPIIERCERKFNTQFVKPLSDDLKREVSESSVISVSPAHATQKQASEKKRKRQIDSPSGDLTDKKEKSDSRSFNDSIQSKERKTSSTKTKLVFPEIGEMYDVDDGNGVYNAAFVSSFREERGKVFVLFHFIGWSNNYDIELPFDSPNINPIFVHTRLYKCLWRTKNDLFWPAKVYFRASTKTDVLPKDLKVFPYLWMEPYGSISTKCGVELVDKGGAWVNSATIGKWDLKYLTGTEIMKKLKKAVEEGISDVDTPPLPLSDPCISGVAVMKTTLSSLPFKYPADNDQNNARRDLVGDTHRPHSKPVDGIKKNSKKRRILGYEDKTLPSTQVQKKLDLDITFQKVKSNILRHVENVADQAKDCTSDLMGNALSENLKRQPLGPDYLKLREQKRIQRSKEASTFMVSQLAKENELLKQQLDELRKQQIVSEKKGKIESVTTLKDEDIMSDVTGTSVDDDLAIHKKMLEEELNKSTSLQSKSTLITSQFGSPTNAQIINRNEKESPSVRWNLANIRNANSSSDRYEMQAKGILAKLAALNASAQNILSNQNSDGTASSHSKISPLSITKVSNPKFYFLKGVLLI